MSKKRRKETPTWWLSIALGNDKGSRILPIPADLHEFLKTIYWMVLGLAIIRAFFILLFL
jgi:hypothetical protein